MKKNRLFTLLLAACLSLAAVAQNQLNEACAKAQKSLIEYLRSSGVSASIDTRDNSVNFKTPNSNVLYWVTFDGEGPVLYTIHRKGVKFDGDTTFRPECALIACNEVNNKHKIKSIYNGKKVEFIMQTYAKEPSDFYGGLKKMIAAFNHVDETFKKSYEEAYKKWVADSVEAAAPIIPPVVIGKSPLTVTEISFANVDMGGSVISDYNKPLRKSECRHIKTRVGLSSKEKGVFKVAMKIYNPDGKSMQLVKGNEYVASQNVEFKKTAKVELFELPSYGSDENNFWKAGEYRVEIYDFEKGVLLDTVTFNLL